MQAFSLQRHLKGLFWRYFSLNLQNISEKVYSTTRAYSRPLMGATIAPNLVP